MLFFFSLHFTDLYIAIPLKICFITRILGIHKTNILHRKAAGYRWFQFWTFYKSYIIKFVIPKVDLKLCFLVYVITILQGNVQFLRIKKTQIKPNWWIKLVLLVFKLVTIWGITTFKTPALYSLICIQELQLSNWLLPQERNLLKASYKPKSNVWTTVPSHSLEISRVPVCA